MGPFAYRSEIPPTLPHSRGDKILPRREKGKTNRWIKTACSRQYKEQGERANPGANAMPVGQLSKVLQHLRQVIDRQDTAAIPDGDLLRRYVQERDEAAFEALVRRHGSMVFGICQRVLHNRHDAEDAFQASFLVLVSKAATLRSPGMLGSWLHGVAYRTAQHARAAAVRRRAKEAAVVIHADSPDDSGAELRAALDQELERLPEKYRAVVLLCDLEGKTRKDAAQHLGWAEGTVASRLARGRRLLANRLTERGLALTSATVAATISSRTASACVPSALVATTMKAASLFAAGQATAAGALSANVAALARGVLKTMLLTKLKTFTVILAAVALLGAGVAGPTYLSGAAEPGPFEPTPAPGAEPPQANAAKPAQSVPPRPVESDASADLPEQETWRKASVWGKYSNLLKQINVEADRQNFHDFHDYGEWKGTSYAGRENLPLGHWVYVYPDWFIWGARNASKSEGARKASVNGNYCILLKTIEAKEDRKTYDDFWEYGPWSGTSYAGQKDLPPGYWVYVYPNWYIWGARRNVPQDAWKAQANGKYRRLLRKIKVEKDKTAYTEFSDYGYCSALESYAGYQRLPAGYWVYVYPHWYIWGEKSKEP
jgi:RNA polymerase sigma factor (sigma-70 family)